MVTSLVELPERLGEFKPVRVLASGGMGVVYEVRSKTTGESFAAKMSLAKNARAKTRLHREALLHSRCDRVVGVPRLFRFGETRSSCCYVIFELVPNGSLRDALVAEGALEPERALRIAGSLALTLGEIHERGIVHRDVKPGNILLDAFDEPKLTDFGLAKAEDLAPLETGNTFVGTPAYSSPEQLACVEVGPASDVFGLGCVLFEMLTGQQPFRASTITERMERIEAGPAISLLTAQGITKHLASIIADTLAISPDERPQNGTELARLLGAPSGIAL